MTDQHQDSKVALDKLYRQRKSLYKAPRAIQKQVMQAATMHQSRSFKLNLLNWTSGISLAATTLFLISLVASQWRDLPQLPTAVVHYNWVEFHSLEEEYANVPGTTYSARVKYEQNYSEFLSRQQTLARHHDKIANLRQLDEGWELTTCDEQLVKISAELVQALSNLKRISKDLKSGDWVDMAFNKDGRIISITPRDQYHSC